MFLQQGHRREPWGAGLPKPGGRARGAGGQGNDRFVTQLSLESCPSPVPELIFQHYLKAQVDAATNTSLIWHSESYIYVHIHHSIRPRITAGSLPDLGSGYGTRFRLKSAAG